MPESTLRFRTLDLRRHLALAIQFRRDSYVCSFGSDELFVEENGADARGYIEWLESRVVSCPAGHVHVWRGDEIIGQVEMIVGPSAGYINLFYLRPEARGRGYGDDLHHYAVALLQQHQVASAGLSVSPTNYRAMKYYERHGWRDLGPRPGAPHVHELELVIAPEQRGGTPRATPALSRRTAGS